MLTHYLSLNVRCGPDAGCPSLMFPDAFLLIDTEVSCVIYIFYYKADMVAWHLY